MPLPSPSDPEREALKMVTKHAFMLSSLTTLIICFLFPSTVSCTFTITNNCPFTIWPGTLSGAGTPALSTTGFQLDSGKTVKIEAVPGWSGRIWARTRCKFDEKGAGTCQTGDCGGRLECDGSGATPPASLFEITLGQGNDKDFYDVSIVDGYNLPLVAWPVGTTTGACNATGCVSDINMGCPKELQVVGGDGDGDGGGGGVVACKSACEAFGLDQYCCSGQFANPTTCRPSYYSSVFKRACPRAYSYAFDDGTSTFTCKAYNYAILFCPSRTTKPNQGTYSPPPSGIYNSPPSIGYIPPPPPSSGYIPPPSDGYIPPPPASNGYIPPASNSYIPPPSFTYNSPPSFTYNSPPGGGYTSPPSFVYNSPPFQKQSYGAAEGDFSSSYSVLPYPPSALLIFFSLLLLS